MSYTLSVDSSHTFLRMATAGDLSAAEFLTMITEAAAVCATEKLRAVLADHTHASVRHFTTADVQSVAHSCIRFNAPLRGGRLAVVLPGPADYGLGRMWQAYADPELTYATQVFHRTQDALDWLAEE